MNSGIEISEPNSEQITINRVRYFYEFETPSTLKVIEEITFYNKGSTIFIVKYILDSFRPFLHIFDLNGEPLEFYGRSSPQNQPNSETNSRLEINIKFPEKRPLFQDDYRTIRLEYINEVQEMESQSAVLEVPLHKTANIYAFVKQCKNYDFVAHYGILSGEDNNLSINKSDSFFHIYSKPDKSDNRTLLIVIKHKIPRPLLSWYILGGVFGAASVILIPVLYYLNPSGIKEFLPFTAAVISTLIIIKGWLSFKDVDKKLGIYDILYRALIIILLVEILTVSIILSLNQSVKII